MTIDGRGEVGSRDGHDGILFELEFRSFQGAFEYCRLVWVPYQPIRHDRGEGIHHSRDGHATVLTAVAPQVLHRGEPPALEDKNFCRVEFHHGESGLAM